MTHSITSGCPKLSGIWIYPIKSLDGISVQSAKISPGGSLEMDREFALVDAAGKFVNAKRTAKIHRVRSQFNLPQRQVTLSSPDHSAQSFDLDHEREAIAAWFSDFFGFTVRLECNTQTGFPDDLKAGGPTMISEATLATTAGWFDNLSVDDMRSRLRTNLEVSGVPPFWEDRLYSETLIQTGFQIGEVNIIASYPCQRCIVPTRDQLTGEPLAPFQKTIIRHRKSSLPTWANPQMFNHYYRLAINTQNLTTETGKVLRVGTSLKG